MNDDGDTFWKSGAVRASFAWFVAITLTALLSAFAWNMAYTSELAGDMKLYKVKVDDLKGDVKEIKSDVKTLLERKP